MVMTFLLMALVIALAMRVHRIVGAFCEPVGLLAVMCDDCAVDSTCTYKQCTGLNM